VSLLRNIDIQIVFEWLDKKSTRTVDLRSERNNIESRMRRKAKSSFTFNLRMPNHSDKANPHKVTVRLYYFPKILEEETRPIDEYEKKDLDLDKPILSCYWEGRWIPYESVTQLKMLEQARQDTQHKQLLRRLRGSIFFPHSYTPTNNKLKFQAAPHTSLEHTSVQVMKENEWEAEGTGAQTAVKKKFVDWIKQCHEKFDRDIAFSMNKCGEGEVQPPPKYDTSREITLYDRVKYGHAEYILKQKVCLRKERPQIFGEILEIWREGDHSKECVATSKGWITLKRHPLAVFGCSSANELEIEVTRLCCDPVPEEESGQDRWKEKVENLCAMLPFEILVTPGKSGDKETQELQEGRTQPLLRERPKIAREKEIKNTEQRVTAGYKIPDFNVVILDRKGKAVKPTLCAVRSCLLKQARRI